MFNFIISLIKGKTIIKTTKKIPEHELTSPELLLLSKFKKADFIENHNNAYWDEVLPYNVNSTLQYFIEQSLLIEPDLKSKIDSLCTGADLKKILKENDLKQSGKKEEQIDRICENLPKIANEITTNKNLYICSDFAIKMIDNYKEGLENLLEETENKIAASCLSGDFDTAITLGDKYKKAQVYDGSWGDKISIDRSLLKTILNAKPKILNGLNEEVLNKAKGSACVCALLGCSETKYIKCETNFRLDFATCARMILFYGRHKQDIIQWKKDEKKIEEKYIITIDSYNECEECSSFKNKKYTLKNIPELPNPKCKNTYGCKCTYTVDFEEDSEEIINDDKEALFNEDYEAYREKYVDEDGFDIE